MEYGPVPVEVGPVGLVSFDEVTLVTTLVWDATDEELATLLEACDSELLPAIVLLPLPPVAADVEGCVADVAALEAPLDPGTVALLDACPVCPVCPL